MQDKVTVYHIDDDPRMIRYISEVLQPSAQLQYLGGTCNQAEGIAFVQQHQPALLLLDIEMPGLGGIGVARQLAGSAVKIVFLTNHKDHAIEAFQLNVLHYLLKPVSPDELEALATRYRNQQHSTTHQHQPNQLVIKTTQGIEFVHLNGILYIMGQGAYSRIYCSGQLAAIVASKNLKYFEEQLRG
jgi:DNA-binding LytR/AlgR family response regulator